MCAEARLKSGTGSLAPEYDNLSAVIAAGVHLFPFRTEKLSPPAPMVLGGQPPGRVGRRRISFEAKAPRLRGFPRSGLGSPTDQSGDVNRNVNSTRPRAGARSRLRAPGASRRRGGLARGGA